MVVVVVVGSGCKQSLVKKKEINKKTNLRLETRRVSSTCRPLPSSRFPFRRCGGGLTRGDGADEKKTDPGLETCRVSSPCCCCCGSGVVILGLSLWWSDSSSGGGGGGGGCSRSLEPSKGPFRCCWVLRSWSWWCWPYA
jgi:hypothetical protein